MENQMPMHGADPAGLYRLFGLPVPQNAKILDFSTNTNVVAWDGDWHFPMQACLSNYPDAACNALRTLVAAQNGCPPENVLATNGSNEAIYLIASYFAGRLASFADPLYGEYRHACRAYGAAETTGAADVRFVCNPCNPTGAYIDSDALAREIAANPQTTYVVDEAYIDFLRRPHCPLVLSEHPNLIVLRSLTKIFHLSGARIGYVLASAAWTERIAARQPSWSVNGPAQEAALRFLRDDAFLARTRDFYRAETPRFADALRSVGADVLPSETNFFLIRVADDAAVIRALLEAGLVVRHTRNFKGLDGGFIRVATRLPAENDRFVAAYAAAIK